MRSEGFYVNEYCYHKLTKISKLQSSNHINVSTDPLGTGRGSRGIREGLLGNHWYRDIITLSSKEPHKNINTIYGHNAELFNMKPVDVNSNHLDFKGVKRRKFYKRK